jgi:hypothetical protein
MDLKLKMTVSTLLIVAQIGPHSLILEISGLCVNLTNILLNCE